MFTFEERYWCTQKPKLANTAGPTRLGGYQKHVSPSNTIVKMPLKIGGNAKEAAWEVGTNT